MANRIHLVLRLRVHRKSVESKGAIDPIQSVGYRTGASGDALVPRKRAIGFEEAIKELEGLVERMEQGELTLEDSLKAFERGVELTRQCQQALDEAEQKVDMLTQQDGKLEPEAFQPENDA